MSKSWSDKSEYRTLSTELASSDDLHFERRVIPLLRIIWPELTTTPARRSFDRKGIDHLVWEDDGALPVVVQCKGFQVRDDELGDSQIKQCLKSISSFKDSSATADAYFLIHNRTGKNEHLRLTVTTALNELVEAGKTKRAELWDRNHFLREVFNAMLEKVKEYFFAHLSHTDEFFNTYSYEPITQVPLQISTIKMTQYKMMSSTEPTKMILDPADEILKSENGNITLLIGEAGYGKTTTATRCFENNDRKVFCLEANTIRKDLNGTKQLLESFINFDDIFRDVPDEDMQDYRVIIRPVIELLVKDDSLPIILILDGLDESIYFTRRGGIQTLFNQLRDVKVPVVLTARSEFWLDRLSDFSLSFGVLATKVGPSKKIIKLIELLSWKDNEIIELAKKFGSTLEDQAAIDRVDEFIRTIQDEKYHNVFGDIPKRPLFLRLILETIEEKEIQLAGIARLFYEWATIKIIRDIREPMRWGAIGREPILKENESADITLRLSFKAMMLAAAHMTETKNDELILLPDCVIDDVLCLDEQLKTIENPTGLFLNSLLLPVPQEPHKPLMVRFGHRAYQEFFLALYIYENPDEFQGVNIDDSIQKFLQSIENEGVSMC